MTAETDVCRLRRKNVKALRLSIEQSEREAAVAAAKATKLAKQQNRGVWRMADYIDSSSEDFGVTDGSDDFDVYTEGYNRSGDRTGK